MQTVQDSTGEAANRQACVRTWGGVCCLSPDGADLSRPDLGSVKGLAVTTKQKLAAVAGPPLEPGQERASDFRAL